MYSININEIICESYTQYKHLHFLIFSVPKNHVKYGEKKLESIIPSNFPVDIFADPLAATLMKLL